MRRRSLIASAGAIATYTGAILCTTGTFPIGTILSGSATAQTPEDPENTIYLDLKQGRVVIQMFPDLAPNHVARIRQLARMGFYDNTPFHRVIENFMAQGGTPTGTG